MLSSVCLYFVACDWLKLVDKCTIVSIVNFRKRTVEESRRRQTLGDKRDNDFLFVWKKFRQTSSSYEQTFWQRAKTQWCKAKIGTKLASYSPVTFVTQTFCRPLPFCRPITQIHKFCFDQNKPSLSPLFWPINSLISRSSKTVTWYLSGCSK